jgi:hypothetical protein
MEERTGPAGRANPIPNIMNGIEDRYRLNIPVDEALAFALGSSDLNYAQPSDELRRVMGALVVDTLEYSERWREASAARNCLREKWPDDFRPNE